MIDRRVVLHHGCLAWAGFITLASFVTASAVNDDALWIVAVFELTAFVAAVAAAHQLRHQRDRSAGALLCLSLCAPTFMAYVIGIPALLVGLTLVVRPRLLLPLPGAQRAPHALAAARARRLASRCPDGRASPTE